MKFSKKQVKSYGVSAANFYGKAKAAAKLGRAVYNKYKAGKKVVVRARRAYRKFTGTARSRHYGNDGHNDWTQLRPLTFKVGRGRPYKTLGTFHLEHSRDIVSEQTGTGYQKVTNGLGTFTVNQAYGLVGTSISNYDTTWVTDPFELNPYSNPQTNPIYTLVPGTVAASDKYFIKNTVQRLQFVSLQPTPVKVEVYWLLCNHNTDRDPLLAWVDVVNAQEYLQANNAEGPHTTAATTATAVGYGSVANPNTKPPRTFGHYWKTIHKDQFILQPGENQSMERTFIYNKMITKHLMGDEQVMYLKGLTLVPMVVQNGAVVGLGNDGESFPPANIDRVTYGRTKIGFIHSCKMNFAALPVNRYDINRKEIGYVDGNFNNHTAIIDADDEEISGQPIG